VGSYARGVAAFVAAQDQPARPWFGGYGQTLLDAANGVTMPDAG
jgi:hypothetical protein